ncbi:MAG TPA: class I SAM-dependent methyltransferase [Candidatus Binataceae bacterium]|nr:class I SAM-dependent methyltransferase [Candidatus Binataceae bacterium]
MYRFEDASCFVVACDNCRTETILPHPGTNQLHDFYTDYYNTETPETNMPLLIERSARLFEDLREAMTLADLTALPYLEVGFGNGASLLAAAQAGMEAVGIDVDQSKVREVANRASRLGLKIDLKCGDLNDEVELEGRFSLIKASQVIEHLLDPVGFVRTLIRVLAPRGYLYLECPNNTAAFLRVKNLLRRQFKRMNFYNSLKIGEHLWGFGKPGLCELLRRLDLDIISCRSYPIRHRYLQPENLVWYPSFAMGVRQSMAYRRAYPLLKASIAVFDRFAYLSADQGMGLRVLARKN